jgi:nucleotide-binding universal stress UspA family protein
MRKIIIPTDFSDNAWNAIKYALELFKYEKGEVYFLHAFEDEIYKDAEDQRSEDLAIISETIRKRTAQSLENLIKQVYSVWPNPRHSYHPVASQHNIVDAIDTLTDTINADIIVMGTKGKTDSKSAVLGSNTLKVMRYVAAPVLAIPDGFEYIQPKQIVFATNYLIPYKRRELKLLCDLAVPYRANIDMVYVAKAPSLSLRQEVNRQFMEDTLCKNSVHFKHLNATKVYDAINDYCNQTKADMLVMVNSRDTYLEEMLFNSTVDAVALESKIPLLTLQNIRRD